MPPNESELAVVLSLKDELSSGLRQANNSLGNLKDQIDQNSKSAKDLTVQFGAASAAISASLGLMARSAANMAEGLERLSNTTGISLEKLGQLKVFAERSGVSVDGLARAVFMMQRNLASGGEVGDRVSKTMAQLGLSLETVRKQAPLEQLKTIGVQLNKIQDPAKRSALSMEAFGRGAFAILPVLGKLETELEGAAKEADALGLSNESLIRKNLELDNSLDRINEAFEATKLLIGQALAPAFERLANITTGMVKVFNQLPEGIKEIANTVASMTFAVTGAVTALLAMRLALIGIRTALDFVSKHPILAFLTLLVTALTALIGIFLESKDSAEELKQSEDSLRLTQEKLEKSTVSYSEKAKTMSQIMIEVSRNINAAERVASAFGFTSEATSKKLAILNGVVDELSKRLAAGTIKESEFEKRLEGIRQEIQEITVQGLFDDLNGGVNRLAREFRLLGDTDIVPLFQRVQGLAAEAGKNFVGINEPVRDLNKELDVLRGALEKFAELQSKGIDLNTEQRLRVEELTERYNFLKVAIQTFNEENKVIEEARKKEADETERLNRLREEEARQRREGQLRIEMTSDSMERLAFETEQARIELEKEIEATSKMSEVSDEQRAKLQGLGNQYATLKGKLEEAKEAQTKFIEEQERARERIEQFEREGTIGAGFSNALKEFKDDFFNFKDAFMGVFRSMESGFSRAIETMLDGGKKFKNVMKDLFNDIKRSFFKMISDMLARNLMQAVLGGVGGGGGGGGLLGLGLGAAGAAAGGAAGIGGAGFGFGLGGVAGAAGAAGAGGLLGGLTGMLPLLGIGAGLAIQQQQAAGGSALGSAAGGALAGASAGALLGSVVPGIGTLVGAIGGGLLGGVGGFFGGKDAEEEKEKMKEQQEEALAAQQAALEEARRRAADLLKTQIRTTLGGGLATPEAAVAVGELFSGDVTGAEVDPFLQQILARQGEIEGLAATQVSVGAPNIVVNATVNGAYDVQNLAQDLGYHLVNVIKGAAASNP